MKFLYTTIIYQPLLNAIIALTAIMPDQSVGYAVIIITICVRTILFPLQHRATKVQEAMKHLEPHLTALKEEHKDNREELARRTLELYKKHGINPFTSFFLLLIQLPILIALFKIFQHGLTGDISAQLYSFVPHPDYINMMFLGINLSQPFIPLAILAAITQFVQVKLMMTKQKAQPQRGEGFGPEFQRAMQTQMPYIIPLMVGLFGMKFAAALPLYWTVMNVLAIVHEGIVRKRAATMRYESTGTQHITTSGATPRDAA
ncbi:MAG: YidC/Oxa1 family membrane protein insertase [Patescibacteria group bacterium]